MRSRILAVLLLIAVVAAVGLLTTRADTDAQATLSADGMVGAWDVTTYVDGQPPAMNLTTFYNDGNVLTSNRPVFPPAANETAAEVRSAGHGNWIANDDGSVDVKFVVLRADANGAFTGQRVLRGHFTLDPASDTWSGPFTATVLDANGAEVAVVPGRAEATRIVAEPFVEGSTPVAR